MTSCFFQFRSKLDQSTKLKSIWTLINYQYYVCVCFIASYAQTIGLLEKIIAFNVLTLLPHTLARKRYDGLFNHTHTTLRFYKVSWLTKTSQARGKITGMCLCLYVCLIQCSSMALLNKLSWLFFRQSAGARMLSMSGHSYERRILHSDEKRISQMETLTQQRETVTVVDYIHVLGSCPSRGALVNGVGLLSQGLVR